MSFGLGLGGNTSRNRTLNTATQGYTPDAEYQGLVQTGLNQALGLMGSYQPLTQENIDRFANPYIEQVGGNISSQLGRSRDIQQNNLNAQAASAGAFGGSGWGLAQAENTRAFADAESQALAGLNAGAYDKAVQAAQTEQQGRTATDMAAIQAYLGGLGLLDGWGMTNSTEAGTGRGRGMNWNANFQSGGGGGGGGGGIGSAINGMFPS